MMKQRFSVPDEYMQGMVAAAQDMMRALLPGGPVPGGAPAAEPVALAQLQMQYVQQQMRLWTSMMTGRLTDDPVVETERGDRRFQAAEWREHALFSLLKQSYLLNSRWLTELAELPNLDEATRHRVRFYMRQFVDAMSPANFVSTNPEVIRRAVESQGESLRTGFENLQGDLRKRELTITDEAAFEVGKNVAVSEGEVIFENEVLQLIQYAPLTDEVAKRPLLIVPPCINKFYILDLQPGNSFVRYAVEQGNTVFVVSWRNPDASCGQLTWDNYVEDGAIKAIDVAREVSGEDQVNALGWCVGGTILSTALAVLAARGEAPVASLTLLTTMVDFRDPGDLGVFIDEQGVAAREQTIGRGGIYPGAELGFVFQTLRANDLIWPNVINHYLKGKAPEAFDLLFWNADTTNLPGPMYAWYLRNAYLENNFIVPGKLTVCGQSIDLGRIAMPSYILATQEDHIVPWRSAYQSTQQFSGESQFVLGASGHIAGVINPPAKHKRSYRTGGKLGPDPESWLASSTEQAGSWWSHWSAWLAANTSERVPARRKLGSRKHRAIEPAPGRYVNVRSSAD